MSIAAVLKELDLVARPHERQEYDGKIVFQALCFKATPDIVVEMNDIDIVHQPIFMSPVHYLWGLHPRIRLSKS